MNPRIAWSDIIDAVATVAAQPGGITARAEALLPVLDRLIHFDAARFALLDDASHCQPTLVSVGYDDRVRRYLDSSELLPSLTLLHRYRELAPVRIKDLPINPADLPVWADCLQPAGFREGIALPLITADGHYLGLFAAQTIAATPLSNTARELLRQLGPLLAHAVDPLRTISGITALIADAVAGIVLTHAGDAVAVPGLPGHRLLRPGSRVLAEAAACHADGDLLATFLAPDPARNGAPRYLRVVMLACPDELSAQPGRCDPASTTRRPAPPESPWDGRAGHAHRGIHCLGCRRPPASIPRAVRIALEHARIKTGAASCDQAVIRAADRGLYIPRRWPRTGNPLTRRADQLTHARAADSFHV